MNNKINIRPSIPTALVVDNMTVAEQFQNQTLRPILKLQHGLFLQVFKQYMIQKKGIFFGLAKAQQKEYIQKVFMRDTQFKNLLKGIVIGQFTVEEYQQYASNSTALNKRMMTMLKERVLSSLEELVK